jgi:hypothetical protein
MDIEYGAGQYQEGKKYFEGNIILSDHKLYLKDDKGEDIAQTYIPLEKISWIKKVPSGIGVGVNSTVTIRYAAVFKGDRKKIAELLKEIIARRGLKKKFLRSEWFEEAY